MLKKIVSMKTVFFNKLWLRSFSYLSFRVPFLALTGALEEVISMCLSVCLSVGLSVYFMEKSTQNGSKRVSTAF